MSILRQMTSGGHEKVIFHHDAESGLRAIVAIHSTLLGPAVGGTRWQPYASEDVALEDVLRLSSAMTQKAAVAGLNLGGGKAVVIGDPAAKGRTQLRAYARFIHGLSGRFRTTTDVGTTTADIDQLREWTPYVLGVSAELGGSGDTSILTGVTVVQGMRAALRFSFGNDSFARRVIAVVGVGKVGSRVARYAAAHGARVLVSDVRAERAVALAREIGAEAIDAVSALETECDVLSPNALGGVLTPSSIPRLRCRIVCGGANNQLLHDPEDARLLAARGIIYAPDYVLNAGGLIGVAGELDGGSAAQAAILAERTYEIMGEILEAARAGGISPVEAAARRVEDRLTAARAARNG